MFLVPYARIEIQSSLPIDETRRRIASSVDTRPWNHNPVPEGRLKIARHFTGCL